MSFERRNRVRVEELGQKKNDTLEKGNDATALFVLEHLKNGQYKKIGEKYKIGEVYFAINTLLDSADYWIDRENSGDKTREVLGEVDRIFANWPKEIIDIFERSDFDRDVLLFKMFGYEDDDIVTFFTEGEDDEEIDKVKKILNKRPESFLKIH